ncbi:DUF6777 domain-containing protein [Streptomyces sp. NPDC006879]|uniref:DUF6777 domain-containing protein n=1 Tax=Streptomyces sp. NPDC006879 TaxID=3364767 RepID=UPI003693A47B
MYASTRRHAVVGVAALGILATLAAGCGRQEAVRTGGSRGGQEIYLQPVAEQGPEPFTASSATLAGPPAKAATAAAGPPGAAAQGFKNINGSTPGLYGGTQSAGSCDVERQVRLLTEDPGRARAFARVSGVSEATIADFLRKLTPVVLRADTRVTNHGYRAGEPHAYQSVLQAGTAVLVDERGLPRLRCASGNPLLPPTAAQGATETRGRPWSGYEPQQVIAVQATARLIDKLVIVNLADRSWIERKVGDTGAQDKRPLNPPPYGPNDAIPTDLPEAAAAAPDPCLNDVPVAPAPDGSAARAPRATRCPAGAGQVPELAPLDPAAPDTYGAPVAPPGEFLAEPPGWAPNSAVDPYGDGAPYGPDQFYAPEDPYGPGGTQDPYAVPEPAGFTDFGSDRERA